MWNKICTYGLFRKGEYNYNYVKKIYGEDSILYIKTCNLEGYKMYDCIFNPSIEQSLESKHKVIVDLIKVDDKAFKFIKEMSTGGSFFEDFINIDDVYYSIFIEHGVDINHKSRPLECGDWSVITQ